MQAVGKLEYTKLLSIFEFKEIKSDLLSLPDIAILKEFLSERASKRWRLLYKSKEDGNRGVDFHRKCDFIPNTLTIIKSHNGYVFGGFTTQTWNALSRIKIFKTDPEAFVFSLNNAFNRPLKFHVQNPAFALTTYEGSGPCFSKDISIHANFTKSVSTSRLFHNYQCDLNATIEQPDEFLAGSEEFLVNEIEVFALVD